MPTSQLTLVIEQVQRGYLLGDGGTEVPPIAFTDPVELLEAIATALGIRGIEIREVIGEADEAVGIIWGSPPIE